MAQIHRTTMSPTKLELLAAWLPAQPWYRGTGNDPVLRKAGGFRLDDPAGEVGIEFMVVADGSHAGSETHYLIPLSYRAAPLDSIEDALIGTSEHGVLGTRWIYDGIQDPVLAAQLLALLQGRAEPQAQSISDTPDRTVTRSCEDSVRTAELAGGLTVHGPDTTELRLRSPQGGLLLRVNRRLRSADDASAGAARTLGRIEAGWLLPDGTETRESFFFVTGGLQEG
jgi:hypothetical protein